MIDIIGESGISLKKFSRMITRMVIFSVVFALQMFLLIINIADLFDSRLVEARRRNDVMCTSSVEFVFISKTTRNVLDTHQSSINNPFLFHCLFLLSVLLLKMINNIDFEHTDAFLPSDQLQ